MVEGKGCCIVVVLADIEVAVDTAVVAVDMLAALVVSVSRAVVGLSAVEADIARTS